MKILPVIIIVILVITSIVSNVSVFADNGTLRLGPPPKIPVRQVYPSPCCDGYATTWPNIRGISLTLIGTEHRLGSTLTLAGRYLPDSQIELDLHASNGRIIQNETALADKTGVFSSFDLKIPLDATLGIWNVNATSGNIFEDMQFNVEPPTPLKQLESGTNPREIQCDLGFILVIKAEQGSPACVRLDTAQRLVERGWENEIVSNKIEVFPNLKLIFSTNSSTVQSGHSIGIDISLNNTSTGAFSVKDRDLWPYNDMRLDSCSNLPIGIAILKGYYNLQNMSEATSLWLYPNLPCPPLLGISSYAFLPLSDMAARECGPPFSCHDSIAIKGHLAFSYYLSGNSDITPFQLGNYTIVGGDEWGDVAVQHFTVVNSTDITQRSIINPNVITIPWPPQSRDQHITVVIGVNNTVKWAWNPPKPDAVTADNDNDPDFAKAAPYFVNYQPIIDGTLVNSTQVGLNETEIFYEDHSGKIRRFFYEPARYASNMLDDRQPFFEYTFTKIGTFGYHGEPWERCSITVLNP